MADVQREFQHELDTRGRNDVADAVGMPDEQDYQTLCGIIARYENAHPGEIQWHIQTIRTYFTEGRYGKNIRSRGQAEVNSQSRMRHAVDIPMGLGQAIERVFPSMFKSKRHLRWFCKKFPGLTVSGRPL